VGDYGGVPVQSRLDWFTEIGEVPSIVDLKTCSDLDSFEYDARKFLYGIQFAFYQQILVSAAKGKTEFMHMVSISTRLPLLNTSS
jgi:hypothetical protein